MIRSLLLFIIILNADCIKERPIIVFHGLGDSCENIKKQFNNDPLYYCVESGEGVNSLQSLNNQVDKACMTLYNIKTERGKQINKFIDGIYLLGLSQGGLLARGVFQFCESIAEDVKGIITVGTPNLGISKVNSDLISTNKDDSVINSVFKWIASVNVNLVQKKGKEEYAIGPSEYLSISYTNEQGNVVRNRGTFITKLEAANNGGKKYANLELFVNIMFTEDEIIHPTSSSTFGTTYNEMLQVVNPFTESPAYVHDYFKLKTLYHRGRLVNCAVVGSHLQLPDNFYKDIRDMLSLKDCSLYIDKIKVDSLSFYDTCVSQRLDKLNYFLFKYQCSKEMSLIKKTRLAIDFREDTKIGSSIRSFNFIIGENESYINQEIKGIDFSKLFDKVNKLI